MVVREGQGPLSSGSRRMLERLVEEAGRSPSPSLQYVSIEAKTVPQARKESLAVQEAVIALSPDRVLTMGPLALMAVRGDQRKSLITDERGRMQWVTLGSGDDQLKYQTRLLPTMDPALVWANPNYFRDFAYDVIKWASRDQPFIFPNLKFVTPWSVEELKEALVPLAKESTFSLDLETSGLNPLTDEIISVGIGSLTSPTVIIPRELCGLEEVRDLVWDFLWIDPLQRIVLHNAKFDLEFLAAQWWGALPDGSGARLGDTQLLHHLLDERPVRSRYRSHGLKDLARVKYDIPNYAFDHDLFQQRLRGDEGVEPLTNDDWEQLYKYHAMDCVTTLMLWQDLTEEARDESKLLLECHENLQLPATLALAEAELRGVKINTPYLVEEQRKATRRLERREKALQCWLDDPEFKPGSPAQFVKVIKERFGVTDREWPGRSTGAKAYERKTKNPTGIQEIRQLVDRFLKEGRHHEARFMSSVLAWRQDNKYLGTYVEGLLNHTGPDGRVHASFNIGGTETGRLSSSDPNLHAIPKYGSMIPIRKAFQAEPGWVLMEADYSQLELRTAAAMSGDPELGSVYREGRDLHLEVSALIFRKQLEDVSEEERFMAKAINFGVLYGRSGWAISRGDEMYYAEKNLGMKRWSTKEADEYVERWLDEFPVLATWTEHMKELVRRKHYTETPFGRRRRFYLTRPDGKSIGELNRQAVNTPVQSVASDICLASFCRIAEELDRDKGRLISIVHDSILLEVKEEHVAEVAAQIKAIMEEPAVIDTNGVPFKVDVKVGMTLAEEDMRKVTTI